MGQILSEPVTEKETSKCQSSKMCVGSSCMQGWRVHMEDSHSTILSLHDDPSASFFAVFDGHGGGKISRYAGQNLHKVIAARPEYKANDIEAAIKYGFLDIDSEMLEEKTLKGEVAGTTAISVLLKDGKAYCGNVGDSRAIASVRGAVMELSTDHKPNLPTEQQRIEAAGGWIEVNRVNGNLALSRALGDFMFKKNTEKTPMEQVVTACPEVITKNVNEDWEFIVLACDGIWDVLSNQNVIDIIRQRLRQRQEPDIICEELMSLCLAPNSALGGLGCDNMTVIIVCLTNGKSWEEYCASITPSTMATSEETQEQNESDFTPARSFSWSEL